jgi:hypothetical protein
MSISPFNRTAHPSLFNASVVQSTGFHPTLAGGSWLGQTPDEWYRRAKTAIAKFDNLLTRTSMIAAKVEREKILKWVDTAATTDSPAYRYATVKSDLASAESFTPVSVQDYGVERRTNRIEKLESINTDFEEMVTTAENTYGKLPEPTIVNRETIVQLPAETTGSNWTLPLLIGGGAIAVALVITLLAKKKN